jgi:hypothetical protein
MNLTEFLGKIDAKNKLWKTKKALFSYGREKDDS